MEEWDTFADEVGGHAQSSSAHADDHGRQHQELTPWDQYLASLLDGRQQLQPVRLGTGCTGVASEHMSFQLLNVMVEFLTASEPKECAHKFARDSGVLARHAFLTIEEQAIGEGRCWVHKKRCIDHGLRVMEQRLHFYTAGTPCPAFSEYNGSRYKGTPEDVKSRITNSDSYKPILGFIDFVKNHSPLYALLENVNGINKRRAGAHTSPMDDILIVMKEALPDYTIMILRVCLGTWSDIERKRTFALLVHKDEGGTQKALAIQATLENIERNAKPVKRMTWKDAVLASDSELVIARLKAREAQLEMV